jgi:hypothetical protein
MRESITISRATLHFICSCKLSSYSYALIVVSALVITACATVTDEQTLFEACFLDQSEGWEPLAEPPSNRDELLSKAFLFADGRETFREAWFGIGDDRLAACAYRARSRGCEDAGDYVMFRRVNSEWEQGDANGLDHIILCHERIR